MNTVQLIGRITKDLELRKTEKGEAFLGFTIAVNEYSKDKEYTNYIDCITFGKTAENMSKYLLKGSLISVEGSVSSRTIEKEDHKETILSIKALQVNFLETNKNITKKEEIQE